jgi:hypothetical protein
MWLQRELESQLLLPLTVLDCFILTRMVVGNVVSTSTSGLSVRDW